LAGGVPAEVAVALETPRGAVVDGLLARGFHVYALNPKQLDRFRDRYIRWPAPKMIGAMPWPWRPRW
jgi:hypothetical protein